MIAPNAGRPIRLVSVLALGFLVAGCATTSTKRIQLDPAEVAAEEARQRRIVLADAMSQQRRLMDVAYPILRASTSLCPDQVGARGGFIVSSAWQYDGDWRRAAYDVGLGDELQIVAVAEGSAADLAGLAPGDRLLALDGVPLVTGSDAIGDFADRIEAIAESGRREFDLAFERGGETYSTRVGLEEQCAYPVIIQPNMEVNAFADGRRIFVTAGMMRFASDHELAVILSHELAHNAMGHIGAMRQNTIVGAILGVIADVAVTAATGYSTEGAYTTQGARIGAEAFSRDFENEADYVGMYSLALAGVPLEETPNLWRHMAVADPTRIEFARTHPTSAERFLRLERAAAEIRYKRTESLALAPDPKGAEELADIEHYAVATPETEETPSAFVDPVPRREGRTPEPEATLAARPDSGTSEEAPPAALGRGGETPERAVTPAPRERSAPQRAARPRWGDKYWGPSVPPPAPSPVPLASGWLRAREWTGTAEHRTETFTVPGEWRIVWRSGDRPDQEPLLIRAFESAGEQLVARVSQEGPAETSLLHLPRGGTYHLLISGGGGEWYVAVEVPTGR